MLWKPSPRTLAHFKRQAWAFWPFWLGSFAYSMARELDWLSARWDKPFSIVFVVLFLIFFALTVVGMQSAYQDLKKSPHPNPDVAALIDGEIDIGEYRKRKEEHDRASTASPGRSS